MRSIELRLRKVLNEHLSDSIYSRFYNDEVSSDGAFRVKLDESLVVALGIDSLDQIELIMAVEDEFAVDIEDDTAEKFTTLQQIIDYLQDVWKIENDEVFGYPEANPIVYLDKNDELQVIRDVTDEVKDTLERLPVAWAEIPENNTPRKIDKVVVIFANQLTKTGFDANVYTDIAEASEFASTLKARNIYAELFELRPV